MIYTYRIYALRWDKFTSGYSEKRSTNAAKNKRTERTTYKKKVQKLAARRKQSNFCFHLSPPTGTMTPCCRIPNSRASVVGRFDGFFFGELSTRLLTLQAGKTRLKTSDFWNPDLNTSPLNVYCVRTGKTISIATDTTWNITFSR